jgi:hypothetical protein
VVAREGAGRTVVIRGVIAVAAGKHAVVKVKTTSLLLLLALNQWAPLPLPLALPLKLMFLNPNRLLQALPRLCAT